MYSQGLLLKQEYPIGSSTFEFNVNQVEGGYTETESIVLPNRIVRASDQRELYKRGQLAPTSDIAKQFRPSTPNYLKGETLKMVHKS